MSVQHSIVTPCFNQPAWLKLCCASTHDQAGVCFEHIIHDGSISTEVAKIAQLFNKTRLFQEKDRGMYDAVNRGIAKANGHIVSYINCDEQYLPEALMSVHAYFADHPGVDIVFGGVHIIDCEGKYICSRPPIHPSVPHILTSHLPVFTAAMFFRKTTVESRGEFNPSLKTVGDAEWVVRQITAGAKIGSISKYLAAFIDSGENMGLKPDAVFEKKTLKSQAPKSDQICACRHVLFHRLKKFLAGYYFGSKVNFSIYRHADVVQRHVINERFSSMWISRLKL